ncbi:hypothetical protein [Paraliobacillus ryukyuensis]|uniref:hypothetical protein n=1 Tax=Paraliobacillus ryukyuensis TaxID=200904 RepID=UPI0015C4DF77|nr:hypothetical protein [Paraliobacillus ryukyuensis]
MKNRIELIVILFFVLGSTSVSTIDILPHQFASMFYGTAMVVLIAISAMHIYQFFKKT